MSERLQPNPVPKLVPPTISQNSPEESIPYFADAIHNIPMTPDMFHDQIQKGIFGLVPEHVRPMLEI